MCQAFECGKGVSLVKEWLHSQLKETNALWFCRACYHKEVRFPASPNSPSTFRPRTVSTHLASFNFFIFRRRTKTPRRREESARVPRPVSGTPAKKVAGGAKNATGKKKARRGVPRRERRRRSKRRPTTLFLPPPARFREFHPRPATVRDDTRDELKLHLMQTLRETI